MEITVNFNHYKRDTAVLLMAELILWFIEDPDNSNNKAFDNTTAIFLLIDEESIDNGNEPNNFSDTDVNHSIADIGLRQPLRYFRDNVGKTIDLYTGQVGDEAWFTRVLLR